MSFPVGPPEIEHAEGNIEFTAPVSRSEEWVPEVNHVFENRDGDHVIADVANPREFRFEGEYLFDDLGDGDTQLLQNWWEGGTAFTFKPHAGEADSVSAFIADFYNVEDAGVTRRSTRLVIKSVELQTTIFVT